MDFASIKTYDVTIMAIFIICNYQINTFLKTKILMNKLFFMLNFSDSYSKPFNYLTVMRF